MTIRRLGDRASGRLGARVGGRMGGRGNGIASLTGPTAPTLAPPLVNPKLWIAGASLESFNYFGLTGSWYGYNPAGWLFWSDALDAQCMFAHTIAKHTTLSPYWQPGSNYAESGATYSTQGVDPTASRSISQQIDAIIAAATGTNNAIFLSPGRNGFATDTAATVLAQAIDMVDRCVVSGKFGLIMVPDLTMRDTSAGGDWASAGVNRQKVLDYNAGLVTMAASRPLVVHVDWFNTFSEAGGDRNPKAGYLCDGTTHDAPKGGYAKGRYLKDKVAATRVVAQNYPSRAGDDLLTDFSGTGGAAPINGASMSPPGNAPTGFAIARLGAGDAATVVGSLSGSVFRMTVTPAASQPGVANAGTVRSDPGTGEDQVQGTSYIARARVQIPITTVSYACDFRLQDQTGGSTVQNALSGGLTQDGFIPVGTLTAAQLPWENSVAHDLYMRTPPVLAPASPKGVARFHCAVNEGTATALPIDILSMHMDPQ